MADSDAPARRRPSVRLIAALLLGLLMLIFVVENTRRVKIRFIFPEVSAPVWVALLVAALIGLLAGLLFGRRRDR